MDPNQISKDGGISGGDEVEIVVKAIGPSRPSRMIVPSRIKVSDLRNMIAANGHLPVERLKMVLKGEMLNDGKSGEDVYIQLNGGDCLIVAIKPIPPAKHLREGFDDDDDDDDLVSFHKNFMKDLKFQIPESASRWKRRLFCFLSDKLKLPNIMLMALFSISLKAWCIIILWFVLAPVAYRWGLGPIYVLGTGFSIILLNLGQRQQGDLSAYSIFNEGFRELPGTLNADRIDRDIRAGQL